MVAYLCSELGNQIQSGLTGVRTHLQSQPKTWSVGGSLRDLEGVNRRRVNQDKKKESSCSKYGSTMILSRTGRPSKIHEKTGKEKKGGWWWGPGGPATLKKLQKYTGCVEHVNNNSSMLINS